MAAASTAMPSTAAMAAAAGGSVNLFLAGQMLLGIAEGKAGGGRLQYFIGCRLLPP